MNFPLQLPDPRPAVRSLKRTLDDAYNTLPPLVKGLFDALEADLEALQTRSDVRWSGHSSYPHSKHFSFKVDLPTLPHQQRSADTIAAVSKVFPQAHAYAWEHLRAHMQRLDDLELMYRDHGENDDLRVKVDDYTVWLSCHRHFNVGGDSPFYALTF